MNSRVNIFIVVLLQIIIMIRGEGRRVIIEPSGVDHCFGINSIPGNLSEKVDLQVEFRVYNSIPEQKMKYIVKQSPLDRDHFIYTASNLESGAEMTHFLQADKNNLPYFCFVIETKKGFKGKKQEVRLEISFKNSAT